MEKVASGKSLWITLNLAWYWEIDDLTFLYMVYSKTAVTKWEWEGFELLILRNEVIDVGELSLSVFNLNLRLDWSFLFIKERAWKGTLQQLSGIVFIHCTWAETSEAVFRKCLWVFFAILSLICYIATSQI